MCEQVNGEIQILPVNVWLLRLNYLLLSLDLVRGLMIDHLPPAAAGGLPLLVKCLMNILGDLVSLPAKPLGYGVAEDGLHQVITLLITIVMEFILMADLYHIQIH